MKIVVIGGSGLIGSRVVTRLRQRGHEVLAASPSTGVNTVTGEGLAKAFAARGAVQCGFCTPGFVVAATALLDATTGPLDAGQVAEALAGNLCRCTGYQPIVAAVLDVARERA